MRAQYWTIPILCSCMVIMGACSNKEKDSGRVEEKVSVAVQEVTSTSTSCKRTYSGVIEAGTSTSVSFATPGTVSGVKFKEGQHIGKGVLMATLDSRSLESAYQSSQSVRRQAEDAFNRMKILHERGSLPEIEWVEVQSKLQQAISADEMAKKALDDTRLYSPISGIIVDKAVEPGQNVMPGIAVCKIVSTDGVKFKINVPEREINSIKMGQSMTVAIPSTGIEFTGKVVEKGADADAISRSYPVWLSLTNQNGMLKPGMLGEANTGCDIANSEASLSIPIGAVKLNSDNRTFVWIVKDGRTTQRFVEIGNYTDNGEVEITEGLKSGEIVVTGGIQKIGNGTEVTYGK